MHKKKRVAVVLTALMSSACATRAVRKERPIVDTSTVLQPLSSRRVVEAPSKKKQIPEKPKKRAIGKILADFADNEKRYNAMYELSEADLSSLEAGAAGRIRDSVLEAMRFDSEVAVPGVKVLGKLADPAAIPELARHSRSREAPVRAAVAKALANFPREDSVFILIDLMGDRDQNVGRAAVESLGKIGPAAAKTLAPVLASGNPDLQYAAVEALSIIGEVGHVVPLFAHNDSKVVYHAVTVAGNIRDTSATSALVALMGHTDSNVRGTAANALRKIGDKSALGALARAAENDQSEFVRAAARHAVDALNQ